MSLQVETTPSPGMARPSSALRRVGILGGTFDPPHIAHIVVAHQVQRQLGLDSVVLVVANNPWQKEGTRPITPAATRFQWVSAAVEGIHGLDVSDVELRIGGPSYTIDTLEVLVSEEPETEWLVVVGADAAAGLDTWHRADELRTMAEVVVVNRPGGHANPPPLWRITNVEVPSLDLSSSDLRAMVAAGKSVRFLVPDRVVEMMAAAGAYRSQS